MNAIVQDDDNIAITDEAIIKNLGSIKLLIYRVVLGSSSPDRATYFGIATANKVSKRTLLIDYILEDDLRTVS